MGGSPQFVRMLLAFATVVTLSYFYWSEGGGNLFGDSPDNAVGLGFPLLFFDHGLEHAVPTTHWSPLLMDIGFGLALALLIAIVFSQGGSSHDRHDEAPIRLTLLNESSEFKQLSTKRATLFPNYSLRELTLFTLLIGVGIWLVGPFGDLWPTVLRVFAFGGPMILAWTYWISRDWRNGQAMLIGAVLMAIFVLSAFAGELTNGLNDFSKGIFALIVCWIPQLTFAALLEPMRWYFEASFRSLNIPESTRA